MDRVHGATDPIDVAIVGKYVHLRDAYLSVIEALKHAGFAHGVDVRIAWLPSDELAGHDVATQLGEMDAILVPGGFGWRGVEGKLEAIRFAREQGVPYLGLCLGLQCAVIEFARDVCGLEGANSSEFDPETPHPVIDLLPEQHGVVDMGATMRLGSYPGRAGRGHQGARAVRRARGPRAPPAPLGGQSRVPRDPAEERDAVLGAVARRPPGGDHRACPTIRSSWPGSSTPS